MTELSGALYGAVNTTQIAAYDEVSSDQTSFSRSVSKSYLYRCGTVFRPRDCRTISSRWRMGRCRCCICVKKRLRHWGCRRGRIGRRKATGESLSSAFSPWLFLFSCVISFCLCRQNVVNWGISMNSPKITPLKPLQFKEVSGHKAHQGA